MITGRMHRLPWMLGVVESEGLCSVGSFIANESELNKFDEDFDNLVPRLLDFYHTINESDRLAVTSKIRKEYFGDQKITNNLTKEIIQVGYLYLGLKNLVLSIF